MTNDLPDWASVIARPDTILSGSPVLYSSGSSSTTFAVPTGVHILSLVLQDWPDVTQLLVQGVQTTAVYLNENPSQLAYQHQYYVLIPAGADTSVTVTTVASVPGNLWVTGVSDTVAVASLPQNPAPWQAPNRPPLKIQFGNPGQNNVAVVIPAPALNQSIWLHSANWIWTVAGGTIFGNWQDATPNVVCVDEAVVAGNPRYVDWKGAKLASGKAYEFLQTGGSAAGTSNCFGTITYSVY